MGNTASDKKNARFYGLKLSKNTDTELIKHLDSQESIQGYLKQLIRNDMMKGDKPMKKIYDLRINSHGKAQPMADGFFKGVAQLVNGYNEDDYVIEETETCLYRINKHDLDKPCIREFLKR